MKQRLLFWSARFTFPKRSPDSCFSYFPNTHQPQIRTQIPSAVPFASGSFLLVLSLLPDRQSACVLPGLHRRQAGEHRNPQERRWEKTVVLGSFKQSSDWKLLTLEMSPVLLPHHRGDTPTHWIYRKWRRLYHTSSSNLYLCLPLSLRPPPTPLTPS